MFVVEQLVKIKKKIEGYIKPNYIYKKIKNLTSCTSISIHCSCADILVLSDNILTCLWMCEISPSVPIQQHSLTLLY